MGGTGCALWGRRLFTQPNCGVFIAGRCTIVTFVAPGGAQTNMVFINVEPQRALRLREYLKSQGMLISGQGSIRLVTHLDVERADIDRFAAAAAMIPVAGDFACSLIW